MAIIFVDFTFVNKKGETKTVHFPMDKESYKVYHDPSVPAEWTEKMMLEEYMMFCDEQKHKRRFTSMPTDEEGREIDIPDNSPSILDQMIEREEAETQRAAIVDILKQLPSKQKEAFVKVHLEGKKSVEAAKEMGISKGTFSEHLNKAEATVERILDKKIF